MAFSRATLVLSKEARKQYNTARENAARMWEPERSTYCVYRVCFLIVNVLGIAFKCLVLALWLPNDLQTCTAGKRPSGAFRRCRFGGHWATTARYPGRGSLEAERSSFNKKAVRPAARPLHRSALRLCRLQGDASQENQNRP